MKSLPKFFACLTVLLFVTSGSYPAIGQPNDLTLQSVTAVDKWDLPEFVDLNPRLKKHVILLKAEFVTMTNLGKFFAEHPYNVGSHAVSCKTSKYHPSLSSVYWRGAQFTYHPSERVAQEQELGGRPFVYYIFIDVQRPDYARDIEPFDLSQQSKDICFRLHSAQNGGFSSFYSNYVKILKETISAALQKPNTAIRQ